MNTWHSTNRKWQSPLSNHWELVQDGVPTGIICRDFNKYPECPCTDWNFINLTFGFEPTKNSIPNQIQEKAEQLSEIFEEQKQKMNNPEQTHTSEMVAKHGHFDVQISENRITIDVTPQEPTDPDVHPDIAAYRNKIKQLEHKLELAAERGSAGTKKYRVTFKWPYGEQPGGLDYEDFDSIVEANGFEACMRKRYPTFDMTDFKVYSYYESEMVEV